jgi:hypothetical protein
MNVVAFHFDEANGVQPTDTAGNAGDLATIGSEPASTDAFSGSGRTFAGSSAYLSHGDISEVGTLCDRDLTVQVILSLAAVPVAAQAIYVRGTANGPAGDMVCAGLELVPGITAPVGVRLFWQDLAGAFHYQPQVDFDAPLDQFFMLTATRTWRDSTAVDCSYYIADELIGATTTADGSIGGGTTALITVGAQRIVGVWSKHFNGTLDDLIVHDHAAPLAEVRHIWLMLTSYAQLSRTAVASLMPAGPDFDAPHKLSHRWITLAAQAVALAWAQAEYLRKRFWPQDCDEYQMAEWEYHYDVISNGTLAQRSARVIAAISEPQGHSIPALRSIFSLPFEQDQAAVNLVELNKELREPWDSLIASRWYPTRGLWSAVAGVLSGSAAASSNHSWATRRHATLRTIVCGQSQDISATLSILTNTLAVNAFAGLAMYNPLTWEGVAVGVRRNGVGLRIVTMLLRANGTTTVVDRGPASAETYVCFRPNQDPALNPIGFARIDAGWCDTSAKAEAGGYVIEPLQCGNGPTWLGPTITCEDIHFSTDQATFGPLAFLDRQSRETFRWYAYRDPMLAGNADLVGSEYLARRVKPSRTSAHAIDSLTARAGVQGVAGRVPCGASNRVV